LSTADGRLDFTTLTLTDVTRTFGRRRALHRVSLHARAGETIALLGPNGAGKSTLLSIVATLLAATSGQVRYGEHDGMRAGAALRARLGLLGHDLYLYAELSPAENLRFFARAYSLDDVERRIADALAHAGLSHRRDDPVSGFSRGMRQRLALERALLHGPRLVLLDEPFTGLDDAATHALRQRLATLRDSGAIVLVTTHDLETIEGIVDRAIVLRDGVAVELPGGGSLRERYRASMARLSS
jgi:heme exporter protein A